MNYEQLFHKLLDIQEYCRSPGFDRGVFSLMVKEYTGWYKKLDYQEQGELSELLRIYYENKR